MATADSNRMLLSRARETGFGEYPPDPAPTLIDTRYTSESLGQGTETTQSAEIRDDRQVSDIVRTNVTSSGSTAHELSYQTFDDLLESMFLSDTGFSAPDVLYTGTAATFVGSTTQTVGATGIDDDAVLGEWVFISGAAQAANNGYFKIVGIATDLLTLARGDAALVAESPAASVTVTMLGSILNGVTLDTYVFEKRYTDLATNFAALTGQSLNQGTLNISTGAIVTLGFDWLGTRERSTTATVGTGTNTAASSTSVMNAVDNIVRLIEGSGQADLCVQTLTAVWNNNLRAKNCIGRLGPFAMGTGTLSLTGTIQAFYETVDIMNSYLDFTDSHIATRFVDAAGNAYILDIPRIKYTNARRVSGGINTDIIADMTWEAYRDSDEGVTCRLVRRPVA